MKQPQTQTSNPEKIWKFGRDFNGLVAGGVGAIALAIPGPNQLLAAYAALNAAQAVFFETSRQWSEKQRIKKLGSTALSR